MQEDYVSNGVDHGSELHIQPPRIAKKETPPVDYSQMITVIAAWVGILNARLLAVVALIGALFMFGFAMYDPSSLRLWGASLYAGGVLWPVIALFLRKG
jgi:hypothetical protein